MHFFSTLDCVNFMNHKVTCVQPLNVENTITPNTVKFMKLY